MSKATTSGTTESSAAAVTWKNPTAADCAQYNLRALPDTFEATTEELALLQLYAVRKSYEKNAVRLREETARANLAKREEAHRQRQMQLKTKKKKKKKQTDASMEAGDESDAESEADEDDDDEDSEEDLTEEQNAEMKLKSLREEVENAKRKQEEEANHDEMRDTMLETAQDHDDVFIVRKKPKVAATTSLLDNLTNVATPPHNFSSKLGLTPVAGRVLFPTSFSEDFKWEPPEGVYSPNEGAFMVDLEDFDINRSQSGGNNTVAIKFAAPLDSKRFSLNIAEKIHSHDFDSILFHFNPRKERGGKLVINDKKEGIWGQALNIPLTQVPLMFGQDSCTLIIQINEDGFDVFVEGKHCARLEHRRELPSTKTTLVLQCPSTDDYGKTENWAVYKVWWGSRPSMSTGEMVDVPGVGSHKTQHPRKIFVSGLKKIRKQPEVDVRKAELERAFRAYGGGSGVSVLVPVNASYAFVEMESEQMADLALVQMAGKYKMNRARLSRHEALQEKRGESAKAKAASSGWD